MPFLLKKNHTRNSKNTRYRQTFKNKQFINKQSYCT